MIVTALLATEIARVAHGMSESVILVDEILSIDHRAFESVLFVGDEEFRTTKDGPFPNHQMRISSSPVRNFAALNYMDNDDAMPIANSYNPARPVPEFDLIFNGTTGTVFPRTALIGISRAREAVLEWLETRKRPTCIEWRPYDQY